MADEQPEAPSPADDEWRQRYPNAVRCSALSKQRQSQCKQPAIPGGTVCHYHGGGSPQVKQKARERLAALVDPSITKLGKLVRSESEAVALGAVKDVLDRNGFKSVETLKIIQATDEQLALLDEDELKMLVRIAIKMGLIQENT